MEMMAAEERKTAASTPANHGNGRPEPPKQRMTESHHDCEASRSI